MAFRDCVTVTAGKELDMSGDKSFSGRTVRGTTISYIQLLGTSASFQCRFSGNQLGYASDYALSGKYIASAAASNIVTYNNQFGDWDKLYVYSGSVNAYIE